MRKFNWMTKVCGVSLLWAMAAALPAQTLTTLHSFAGTDGEFPSAGLIQGTDGNLYGTTEVGGASSSCNGNSCGTVFKITPSGTLTTLHSFDLTDGSFPEAGLVQAINGDFYGTTSSGGALAFCPNENGCGTVFKITASGTLTTLYSFCSLSNCGDGAYPLTGLVQATNGDLYGTTSTEGANGFASYGTIFKITQSGALTTLYSFDYTDGDYPGTLIQTSNGDFYGTTGAGGTHSECQGAACGTVFKITPSGTLTTLFNFAQRDGQGPGNLVQGTNGSFYGITGLGGTGGCDTLGCGTVFKITPSGVLTTLLSFDYTDGSVPEGGLVRGTDGNFYGTTYEGGANTQCYEGTCGTLFRITPSGTLTTLQSFDGTNGWGPAAALTQGTDGKFYGTTTAGGANGGGYGDGTIFSLSVGLGQFVETQPTSGPVGGTVKILGTDLTSATTVTFNGTLAAFTVDAHSIITATVPTGATTGKVQVTVPNGTLSSNVPFTVK